MFFQRYTAYGIFLAGGSHYWVRKAARTTDPAEAKAHLMRVMTATQYGVNAAENAVRDLERREDRIRLWSLLIEVAPNDTWRAIYSRRRVMEGRRHDSGAGGIRSESRGDLA